MDRYDESYGVFANHIDYLLNGKGGPSPYGCALLEIPSKTELAKSRSRKPYCVVSDWQLWHFDTRPEEKRLYEAVDYSPTVMYSKNIIFDQQERSPSGYQIRTTPLVRIIDNCIFESINTMYILVGTGYEKETDWVFIRSIIF